jgi:hypothetical protein
LVVRLELLNPKLNREMQILHEDQTCAEPLCASFSRGASSLGLGRADVTRLYFPVAFIQAEDNQESALSSNPVPPGLNGACSDLPFGLAKWRKKSFSRVRLGLFSALNH